MFVSLRIIRLNFESQELLGLGETLLRDKHTKITLLMHDTVERLQLCMNINSIAQCVKEPKSYSYVQRSAEGIPPQLTPPNHRQR